MKKTLLLLLVLMLTAMLLLSACGDDSDADETEQTGTSPVSASSVEDVTMVVIEPTPSGGTVVTDSEGNKITRDSDGNITYIEDPNGAPVDVNEYIEEHPQENTAPPATSPSDGGASDLEDEIPVVIATMPDDPELIEIPGL